ncbi:hypothetical protein OIE66_02360 [Nonomuraea sp. NBC_01738]|uniref:hypothetical protein n=1 Tax=Nonomuraea sp. NBC_01738 TaxID=2976003 RepID=UPI002E106CDC|nr:hypothetical protein OIE66_02360 [Nonomuraea sp. NBC_01738]
MLSRGAAIAGALVLATATTVSVAQAGDLGLVFDRIDDPDMGKWVRTGDVLRFRVKLEGKAEDASLAVAANPGEALSTVACSPSTPLVKAAGAGVCSLGMITGERVVDVLLTVPEGVKEIVLAAVAQVRRAEGVETISGMARTPIGERLLATGAPGEAQPVVPVPTLTPLPSLTPTPTPTPSSTPVTVSGLPKSDGIPEGGMPFKGHKIVKPPVNKGTTPRVKAPDAGAKDHARSGYTAPEGLGFEPPSVKGHRRVPVPAQPDIGLPAVPEQEGGVRLPQASPAAAAEVQGGAPLPRQMAAPVLRAQKETPVIAMTGMRGAPLAAGGIAILLAALWIVARVQRVRLGRRSKAVL